MQIYYQSMLSEFKNFIYNARKSKFIKNVLYVGGGIALAQIITFIFTPLITRIYTPESFGIAAVFTSIMTILSPLATMGYATAVVISRNDKDAIAVSKLSILIGIIVSALTFIVIVLCEEYIKKLIGDGIDYSVLYIIPASMLVKSVLSVSNQSAIREELFKEKAKIYIFITFVMNTLKVSLGVIYPSGVILILCTQFGQLLNLLCQILTFPKKGSMLPRQWLGFKGISNVAIEHKNFLLYSTPQSVIRAAAMGLPVIVLTVLYGSYHAGQYSLAVMILAAPAMLLGESVGEVFFPKISKLFLQNRYDAKKLILKSTIILLTLGTVLFGVLAVYSSNIVPFVFGDKWLKAGQYMQWISLSMIAMLAARPIIAILPIMKKQALLLQYELLVTTVRAISLYVGSFYSNDVISIALFSITNVLGYSVLFFYGMSKITKGNKGDEEF